MVRKQYTFASFHRMVCKHHLRQLTRCALGRGGLPQRHENRFGLVVQHAHLAANAVDQVLIVRWDEQVCCSFCFLCKLVARLAKSRWHCWWVWKWRKKSRLSERKRSEARRVANRTGSMKLGKSLWEYQSSWELYSWQPLLWLIKNQQMLFQNITRIFKRVELLAFFLFLPYSLFYSSICCLLGTKGLNIYPVM